MQIILAIVALSFLIIVHEFGHFIVAKLSGIKVHEFSLFMGPKLFGVMKGETLYSVRLIPLGGFVRMEGEEQASEDERAFNRKPLLVRAAVIAAGPVMNLIVAVVIIAVITSFTGFNTTKVSNVFKGSPAYNSGLKAGDVLVSYDGKRVYQPMDIFSFLFASKGKTAAAEILRDGKTLSLSITPEVIQGNRYILGFGAKEPYGENSNVVSSVGQNTPAEKAGLKPGDEITKLNDKTISTKQDISNYLKENRDKPVAITVLRNGSAVRLNEIVPVQEKGQEQYDLGVLFSHEYGSGFTVVKQSFFYCYSTARSVYYSLAWLITGTVSLNQMMGPVGIVSTIGDVVKQSPTVLDIVLNLLSITAFISINLGIFNLIPFPALDGSKLLLLLIEGIRRKAIPPEKEAFISMVGLVLLILLMIFATSNDIMRIFGKG